MIDHNSRNQAAVKCYWKPLKCLKPMKLLGMVSNLHNSNIRKCKITFILAEIHAGKKIVQETNKQVPTLPETNRDCSGTDDCLIPGPDSAGEFLS